MVVRRPMWCVTHISAVLEKNFNILFFISKHANTRNCKRKKNCPKIWLNPGWYDLNVRIVLGSLLCITICKITQFQGPCYALWELLVEIIQYMQFFSGTYGAVTHIFITEQSVEIVQYIYSLFLTSGSAGKCSWQCSGVCVPGFVNWR